HFMIELTGQQQKKPILYFSYAFATVLAAIHVTTDFFIDGYYDYFFGYYPKAGLLHPLHVIQTSLVVMYSLHLAWSKQKVLQAGEKTKLRFCAAAILIYSLSAIDYACNYGFEFYPPGVVFITIALG